MTVFVYVEVGLKNPRTLPPENQDGNRPPKRVVEELFLEYRRTRYRDIDDAPWILGRARLAEVQTACPQCFRGFVEDLLGMVGGGYPPGA